ncbi:actinoporin-like protein [Gadus chalcogrammus]|uniref:actinoporin-like protein n=1 Tax=Gadus chalcogrammus TaxID=1042646 RepID=UPI0024C4BB64|nr:actinoporin-like protein [Gadus chalcogrammus]
MPESADAVAANMKSRRNVTIEITNLTQAYCLIDPKVFLESGKTHSPPQPTVRPLKTEVCNFTKEGGAACGAVGVMTYDLYHRDHRDSGEKVAVMFSVPYDNNMYKNWFALGVYPKATECDEKLYKEMYYDKEQKGFVRAECNGTGITFSGRNLDVKATMSPLGRAIMKIEVWDKLFS